MGGACVVNVGVVCVWCLYCGCMVSICVVCVYMFNVCGMCYVVCHVVCGYGVVNA